MPVNTLVITGYGTNCHKECAHVARLAGTDKADIVHFADLVSALSRLDDYQFLIFPGGFLDGDDLGAAQAAAQRWLHVSDATGRPLLDSLRAFIDAVQRAAAPPIDVYDTAAWMAVTYLSEQSIALGGAPLPFPDFTNGLWIDREPFARGIYCLEEICEEAF